MANGLTTSVASANCNVNLLDFDRINHDFIFRVLSTMACRDHCSVFQFYTLSFCCLVLGMSERREPASPTVCFNVLCCLRFLIWLQLLASTAYSVYLCDALGNVTACFVPSM
jgi:hypothetical protein